MGLIQELGIEIPNRNSRHNAVAAIASSRPGAWLMSKVAHRLDGVVFRRSGGRQTMSSILAGLPIVMITTTGAKSGLARTSPLTAVPVGEDIALVGTNFGQESTPGWVYNLEADPTGRASHGPSTVDFVAQPADEEERPQALLTAAKMYSGYDKYRGRVTDREVRVFILRSVVGVETY